MFNFFKKQKPEEKIIKIKFSEVKQLNIKTEENKRICESLFEYHFNQCLYYYLDNSYEDISKTQNHVIENIYTTTEFYYLLAMAKLTALNYVNLLNL